jgi:hypothetical protein
VGYGNSTWCYYLLLQPADRLWLTALSRLLPRIRWSAFFITPATLYWPGTAT